MYRVDEQRAQTAPTSLSSWHPMSRAQSQPSLSQESPATARATMAVNYDAMWSASLKNSNQRQHKTDLVKSRKPAGAATDSAPSGSQQLSSVDLERIATANLEIRPRTVIQGYVVPRNQYASWSVQLTVVLYRASDPSARKPHRLVSSILPRPGQTTDSFNFTR